MNELDKYQHLSTTNDSDGWRWYGTKEQPYLYPSVTTILHETVHQPGLINWYKNNSAETIDKKLVETGAIGEELHLLFDRIVNGEEPEIPPQFKIHTDSFRHWFNTKKVTPIKTEFVVASERYGYAGRVDFYGEVAGKKTIVDWKTGTRFGDTWGDQVAAYQMAVCEIIGIPLTDLNFMILQVSRDTGELKEFKYQHLDWMQDSFLLALERFKRIPRFTKLKKLNWPYLMKKTMVRS